jgi:hypothetical protein
MWVSFAWSVRSSNVPKNSTLPHFTYNFFNTWDTICECHFLDLSVVIQLHRIRWYYRSLIKHGMRVWNACLISIHVSYTWITAYVICMNTGQKGRKYCNQYFDIITQQLSNQKLKNLILTSLYLARMQFRCNFSKSFDNNPEKVISNTPLCLPISYLKISPPTSISHLIWYPTTLP